MKANSASVDTQKTWQLNFVLTNGKSNFNLPITGGIGTAVFYDRRNYDHGRSGNASLHMRSAEAEDRKFQEEKKKFRTEKQTEKRQKNK